MKYLILGVGVLTAYWVFVLDRGMDTVFYILAGGYQ